MMSASRRAWLGPRIRFVLTRPGLGCDNRPAPANHGGSSDGALAEAVVTDPAGGGRRRGKLARRSRGEHRSVVRHGQIRLAYRVSGEGRPLVLIPGSGMAMDVRMRSLSADSQRHRVIVFDPASRGRAFIWRWDEADNPADGRRYGATDPGASSWSPRRDGLVDGPVRSEKLVVRHPRLVRRVVLLYSRCGRLTRDTSQRRRPGTRRPGHLRPGVTRRDGYPAVAAEDCRRGWPGCSGFFSQPGCCETVPPDETAVRQVAAEHLGSGPVMVYLFPPADRPPGHACDGRQQGHRRANRKRHVLANRIPNAQLTIFRHAGHAFLFQYPNRVADRVNAFLRSPGLAALGAPQRSLNRLSD